MRLKKIRLAGFKSFVDPTTIPFPGDMTAIVGPNGCGKSNVIDAVRWVLGESSAKNLRGDAMTDVIFNGSSARKPVGQCSVELVFDNSSGRIAGEYAKYNELSIKRLVTRDAVSTYFLNGSKCRRRDVTDLFLGTGLGPRSYAIIEQGMISRLIESKPQELRVFIEEAAGISKYKERRRETENRIRHTQDNLERLEDVRTELARQLDKLQRQAAAARRYTTLKAQERKLKSELAAIRWLKHDDHLQKLQQTQQQHETDIEALRARQRGDEAGIEKYRDVQQSCKQKLDHLQQTLFTVSSTISRLEQSALHNQQRLKQIDAELGDIDSQQQQLEEESQLFTLQTEEQSATMLLLEPEYEIKQAASEQLEVTRDQAEAALHQHQREFQQTDQRYHQVKQQVHSQHSKVQSLLQMQMRTQQRIGEIEQEIREFSQADHQQAIETIELELEMLAEQIVVQEDQVFTARQTLEQAQRDQADQQQQVHEQRRELQQNQSKRTALETLQQAAGSAKTQPKGVQPLWQQLTPKPGAAALLEYVLNELGDAQLAGQRSLASLATEQSALTPGLQYFSQAAFTSQKRPGSVAELLENATVPRWFNDILVAQDAESALALRAQCEDNQIVVTTDGQWFGPDWYRFGQFDAEQGVLQRAQLIEQLDSDILRQEAQLEQSESSLSEATARIEQCREQLTASQAAVSERTNQRQQLTNRLSWLTEQQRQEGQKRQRLDDELARQQQQLEDEATELAMLTESLEGLEVELAEQAEDQARLQDKQQALQQQLSAQRSQYEQNTRELHQLALKLQECRNQQQSLSSQQQRVAQQITSLKQRAEQLYKEKQTLNQPQTEQQDQLQVLLAEKAELEEQRYALQQELEHADELLTQAMQGQQAIIGDIAKRQEQLDSLKIEAEGYRVRGTAILEQLNEVGVTLKSVLETLPAETSESGWQQELEKTSSAIARLGAVNLAAVEEYDVQAERKAHLDTQFDDLNEALETLQNAIRKIDRETRARFSQTFEQVNEDLKQLFPKVFGGGSAYLALTDDDLLETGVTIMARPPGKKNSTIHLLSGGEKALTALSLVFAIFRLNPAPFCLLDEVDAPLDDANVGRFCNLVSEMSKSVQFIYISHNKIAMEMASHLTGVTMAEPGVSRMVAVDVDEAVSLVDA
ncbi:chromosome segregation protein SMC [Alteromonas lipolytica]|uniref:Chromosome partition protein Smc n=1 Tax=Alteromonas lipolytica TaxID=1856405 RepID=A0A1E8FGK2_9ALTE|nr:chromosome segregation protein SMC [Alteromonas lipolytica]OFI35060.1 chromosome segregation protein SMC [Alteromonas lipolytica]GGF56288.1 chromosome partition protein Smc [Alteromonas lipolytica]